MPGHRTHDIIGIVTTLPMVSGVYTLDYIISNDTTTAKYAAVIFGVSHLLNTFFNSPDLDLNSRIYNRWGIVRFIWWPYKQIVRHRSNFSHSAVGGLLRMIYILILCAVAAAVISMPALIHIAYIVIRWPTIIILIMLGSASASWIHVLADKVHT